MIKSFLILILSVFFISEAFPQSRTLDYYLSEALNKSPLLKDYENQLRTGSIDSLMTLCAFKPRVDITSQVLIAPVGHNVGYDEAITNGGNYAAVIGVKQPLFNDKIKTARLENINLVKQTIGVNKRLTQADLTKSITLQYISAYADYELLQYCSSTIKMLYEQQAAVKFMVESGIYLQTDLMNLGIAKESQEIFYKQQYIQYKNDVALLNLLSGIVDTAVVQLEKPELKLKDNFDIRQSPVVLQFTLDSLKNCNAKSMVDLDYRPKFEAFADAGLMAIKPLNIPFNFGTSFGLNLVVPVYDGKLRIQEYQKIEIAENSRKNYRDFYVTQYRQQYLQLSEQLHLTDELIRDISHQISQQNELISLYRAELEKGLARFTDFLSAINSVTNTRNALIAAEMNRMQLINQLNFLK